MEIERSLQDAVQWSLVVLLYQSLQNHKPLHVLLHWWAILNSMFDHFKLVTVPFVSLIKILGISVVGRSDSGVLDKIAAHLHSRIVYRVPTDSIQRFFVSQTRRLSAALLIWSSGMQQPGWNLQPIINFTTWKIW